MRLALNQTTCLPNLVEIVDNYVDVVFPQSPRVFGPHGSEQSCVFLVVVIVVAAAAVVGVLGVRCITRLHHSVLFMTVCNHDVSKVLTSMTVTGP